MHEKSEAVERKLQQGFSLQKSGRLADAEGLYREVLGIEPDNAHALNLLGVVCINAGRSREALQFMVKAGAKSPNDPETQSNLALAYKNTGDLERACAAFERAVELNSKNPVSWNNLGNAFGAVRRMDDAIGAYKRALGLAPDYPECLTNLASAFMTLRQETLALRAIDHAIALRPDFAEAHNTRGEILSKQYRHDAAAAAYRRAISLKTGYAAAMINMAAALKDLGRVDEARQMLEDVVTLEPANARALDNLGTLHEQIGNPSDAAQYFRRAIAASPGYANAYYQLAHLDSALVTLEHSARMVQFIDDPQTTVEDRTSFAFALACVCEAQQDVDGHFRYLTQGHGLKKRAVSYDAARVARYHASLKRTFLQAPPPTQDARPATNGPQVIFVLGLPRSGTSLIEQILSSHPDITGAGEMGVMEDTIKRVQELSGHEFPSGFHRLNQEQKSSLGAYYMSKLVERAGTSRYIIDKTPMNFQYVGFIVSILPNARIVHCSREPMDNCWSIYKLPFEEMQSYAHSLESLGDYYVQYSDLMTHWSHVAHERMLDVRYEETVADVQRQSRRLLQFLGLDYHEAVGAFHRTARIVKTPSASQVRRPIYNTSIAASRPYEPYLGPLREALAALPAGTPGCIRGAPLS
jgi:tetratricopeptide (TPR) repeat protein